MNSSVLHKTQMTFCPKVLELHRKFYISLIDSDVPPEQVVSSCILR